LLGGGLLDLLLGGGLDAGRRDELVIHLVDGAGADDDLQLALGAAKTPLTPSIFSSLLRCRTCWSSAMTSRSRVAQCAALTRFSLPPISLQDCFSAHAA
jgi:hypothetical protein